MEEEERVEYSFTGDVSSLRDATKQAISLLDKYESTIKGLASSNNFEVGKTAFSGFQKTVNGVIKQVNTLSKQLSGLSSDGGNAFAPDTTAVTSAYQNIADTLEYLQSGFKITTDDMKLLTQVLKETKASLDPVVGRAQALGATFAQTAQESQQAMSTVDTAADSTGQRVATLGEQWDRYINRMSKSAELSAQVFAQAGEFSGFTTSVDNAVAKAVLLRSRIEETVASMSASIRSMAGSFDPVTSKLESYKAKATSALGLVRKALDSVSAAFRRTAQATDSSENEANQAAKAYKKLATETERLTKAQSKQSSSSSSLSSAMSGISAAAGSLKGMLLRLIAVKLGRWLANAVKQSINYVENLNLFTVAMGKSVTKGLEFVNAMSEIYGMDPSNLYRYAGYFYQLTDAIGMADDASATLSLSLTKAANDIASLFNVDVESVVEDLASGMQGMSRAVRKYGMDIRATTLQQTALSLGMTEQVESMSEANRMALRYLTMMRQVKNATSQTVEELDGSTKVIGDFAKNIETPANQLRIFKEQVSQLGRAIGNFFVPVLKAVLPVINGVVMALRTALEDLAALVGITDSFSKHMSTGAEETENFGDQIEQATKAAKGMLAPFDELNVFSADTGISDLFSSDAVDPALQDAIANMELSLDNVEMKAHRVRDSLLSALSSILNFFAPIWSALQALWQAYVQPMMQSTMAALGPMLETLAGLWGNVSVIFTSIASLLSGIWSETIQPVLAAFARYVAGVGEVFQSLWSGFIGPVVKIIGDGLQHLWTQTLGPLFANVYKIVGGLIELGLNLWNTCLQPLAHSLVTIFGPAFTAIFQVIWTVVEFVISNIGALLVGLTDSLRNVIEFLNGVFTGDWKRALAGIINIFVGFGNLLVGVIESICNLGVGAINSFLNAIVGGIKGLVNATGGLIEDLAGFLGYDIDLGVNWQIPQIGKVAIPRIPEVAFAKGGVVTSPTRALIGEGQYDEAVIPLGNSPQMRDLVEQIAEAVSDKPSPEPAPIEVKLYIGGREWDAFTYESSQRGKDLVGAQTVKVGG